MPAKYNATMIKEGVAKDKYKPTVLYDYLNVNTGFEGTPIGCEVYRSDNGGQSFSVVSGATTSFMPHRAALTGNGNLYITYGNGAGPTGHWSQPEPMDNGQIWRYNISSGAWTNVTPSGFNRAFGGISVDPNNPNRIVASTINTYMNQNGS